MAAACWAVAILVANEISCASLSSFCLACVTVVASFIRLLSLTKFWALAVAIAILSNSSLSISVSIFAFAVNSLTPAASSPFNCWLASNVNCVKVAPVWPDAIAPALASLSLFLLDSISHAFWSAAKSANAKSKRACAPNCPAATCCLAFIIPYGSPSISAVGLGPNGFSAPCCPAAIADALVSLHWTLLISCTPLTLSHSWYARIADEAIFLSSQPKSSALATIYAAAVVAVNFAVNQAAWAYLEYT